MTQNFISERFAYGVEVHEVDFMKRCDVIQKPSELGQSLRWKCPGTIDGDIYVGVGPGGTLWPGSKPDYLDVCAQDTSGEKCDFLRDLLRPSHDFLVEHAHSVAVLAMMSTGLA